MCGIFDWFKTNRYTSNNKEKYKDQSKDDKTQVLNHIRQKSQEIQSLIKEFEAKQSESKLKIKILNSEAQKYFDNPEDEDKLDRSLGKIACQKLRAQKFISAIQTLQKRQAELESLSIKIKTLKVYATTKPKKQLLQQVNQTLQQIEIDNQNNIELKNNINLNFDKLAQDNQKSEIQEMRNRLKKDLLQKRNTKQKHQILAQNNKKSSEDQLRKQIQRLEKQNKELKQRVKELEAQPNSSFVLNKSIVLGQNPLLKKISKKQNCYQYLYKTMQESKIVDARYFKLTKEIIEACYSTFKFSFSTDGYRLNHQNIPIKMKIFVLFDWKLVESIWFNGCEINDEGWAIFVENSAHFPNLKSIVLAGNSIKTVKRGDLQSFKSLRYISFCEKKKSNPLSLQTKAVLKQFKQKNPTIKVDFE